MVADPDGIDAEILGELCEPDERLRAGERTVVRQRDAESDAHR